MYIVYLAVVQRLQKARVFREARQSDNSSLKWLGRLNVLPNSLRRLWRWLIVGAFNSQATALLDILAVGMPTVRSLETALPDDTAHFRVAFSCGQLKAHLSSNHLSNQRLDMPNLWAGWIGVSEQRRSLTITDLGRFLDSIWEKFFCVHRKRKNCIQNICIFV